MAGGLPFARVFVTFASDYGHQDEFVGVCHGVLVGLAPMARVIDVTHGIPRHDVRFGAIVLRNALPFMPAGVHLAVVDPEVGGHRRAVAVRCADETQLLVGPDNGLLRLAAERFGGIVEAVDIGQSPWRLQPVSATFHGRDIFGPVAAHLARGERPTEEIDPATLARLPGLPPGKVHVVEVDGFGNLITDATLPDAPRARIGGRDVAVGRTFSDVAPGQLVLYEDSAGEVALALNGGSAAAALGVAVGDELELS
jgi:S-adenosylmethionine hydrolase